MQNVEVEHHMEGGRNFDHNHKINRKLHCHREDPSATLFINDSNHSEIGAEALSCHHRNELAGPSKRYSNCTAAHKSCNLSSLSTSDNHNTRTTSSGMNQGSNSTYCNTGMVSNCNNYLYSNTSNSNISQSFIHNNRHTNEDCHLKMKSYSLNNYKIRNSLDDCAPNNFVRYHHGSENISPRNPEARRNSIGSIGSGSLDVSSISSHLKHTNNGFTLYNYSKSSRNITTLQAAHSLENSVDAVVPSLHLHHGPLPTMPVDTKQLEPFLTALEAVKSARKNTEYSESIHHIDYVHSDPQSITDVNNSFDSENNKFVTGNNLSYGLCSAWDYATHNNDSISIVNGNENSQLQEKRNLHTPVHYESLVNESSNETAYCKSSLADNSTFESESSFETVLNFPRLNDSVSKSTNTRVTSDSQDAEQQLSTYDNDNPDYQDKHTQSAGLKNDASARSNDNDWEDNDDSSKIDDQSLELDDSARYSVNRRLGEFDTSSLNGYENVGIVCYLIETVGSRNDATCGIYTNHRDEEITQEQAAQCETPTPKNNVEENFDEK